MSEAARLTEPARALAAAHVGQARALARRLAARWGRRDRIDDTESSVMLGLVEAAARYDARPWPGPFWPPAVRQCIRRCADDFKADVRRRGNDLRLAARTAEAIEEPDAWDFGRYLEGLPPRQAEAIRLRYRDGLGVSDAARALGVDHSTVHYHEARALAALRRRLAPEAP